MAHARDAKQTMAGAIDAKDGTLMTRPVRRDSSSPPAGTPARSPLVTGSAQGIGRKVAERIAAEGGAVVLVDRAELVHEVAQGIRETAAASGSGGSATSVTADLETFAGRSRPWRRPLDRPRPR